MRTCARPWQSLSGTKLFSPLDSAHRHPCHVSSAAGWAADWRAGAQQCDACAHAPWPPAPGAWLCRAWPGPRGSCVCRACPRCLLRCPASSVACMYGRLLACLHACGNANLRCVHEHARPDPAACAHEQLQHAASSHPNVPVHVSRPAAPARPAGLQVAKGDFVALVRLPRDQVTVLAAEGAGGGRGGQQNACRTLERRSGGQGQGSEKPGRSG